MTTTDPGTPDYIGVASAATGTVVAIFKTEDMAQRLLSTLGGGFKLVEVDEESRVDDAFARRELITAFIEDPDLLAALNAALADNWITRGLDGRIEVAR